MFKLIGKTLVLGALGAGALGCLYGKDQVLSWVRQGKQKVEAQIGELQGMSSELAQIRSRVGSLEDEVRRLKEEAVRGQVEVEHVQREVDERQGALDRLRTNLGKARSLLESGADRFVIGGVEYARAEVERDVGDKIELFKVQQETLAQLQQTLATRRSALALCRENVARGEALRGELGGRVRLLEAKLEKHKAREIWAEAVAGEFDASEFNTEIGEVRSLFARFETKLEVKDRMLDERMKVAATGRVGGIDYDGKAPATPADVAGELSKLLGPAGEPAATVVVVGGR